MTDKTQYCVGGMFIHIDEGGSALEIDEHSNKLTPCTVLDRYQSDILNLIVGEGLVDLN